MGDLQRHIQLQPRVQKLPRRRKDLSRVVPDMRRKQLPSAADAGRRFKELPAVHAGLVADPEGDADAAALQGFPNLGCHLPALGRGGGGIAVEAAGLMPEETVTGQHGHIDRRAVPIHEIEIVRRVELVLAAVARDGGGHAHVQHAGEDRLLIVGFQLSFGIDGIFVHVDVEKAGADDLPGGVDHLIGVRGRLGDAISVDPEVPNLVQAGSGVDNGSVFDQYSHLFF